MANSGLSLLDIKQCPHCSISVPNLVFQTAILYPAGRSDDVEGWAIYQCATCHNVVCAKRTFYVPAYTRQPSQYMLTQSQQTYAVIPAAKTVDSDLPDRPKRYLEQAISSLNAPDGAVMLAGSAIDSMLKIKGYVEGSVYQRIEKAVGDNVLTIEMREWAHAVRLESNKPRHADLDEPHSSRQLAEQTIGFAQALGEYLFALPARIERGKAATAAALSVETK